MTVVWISDTNITIKFYELYLWISPRIIVQLTSYIQNSTQGFIWYPDTSKSVLKNSAAPRFSTHFLVSGYQMKHCVLFWIYYFKTFSRLFPSNNFFFQSQHYQIDDRDLQETEEQSFFSWYAVNVRARWSKIWPKQKRCHLKSTCSSFQKNLKTSFLFPRLFSGLENCWANFKTFKNSRLCMNPALLSQLPTLCKTGTWCTSTIIIHFWETIHLPLPLAHINTCFSLRAKCWLGGGIDAGQITRIDNDPVSTGCLS